MSAVCPITVAALFSSWSAATITVSRLMGPSSVTYNAPHVINISDLLSPNDTMFVAKLPRPK